MARQYNVTKMDDVVVSSGTHNDTLDRNHRAGPDQQHREGHSRYGQDGVFSRGPWRAGHRRRPNRMVTEASPAR